MSASPVVTVYPVGASGATRKRSSGWEPEKVVRYERYSCPECGAPMSAAYARAGYVCDTCADMAEGVTRPWDAEAMR